MSRPGCVYSHWYFFRRKKCNAHDPVMLGAACIYMYDSFLLNITFVNI